MAKKREGDYLDEFESSAMDSSPSTPAREGDYLDEFASSSMDDLIVRKGPGGADSFIGDDKIAPNVAKAIGEGVSDAVKTAPNSFLLRQGPNLARSAGLEEFGNWWEQKDAEARDRSPVFTTVGEMVTPNPLTKATNLVRGLKAVQGATSTAAKVGRASLTPIEGAATSMISEHGATGKTDIDTALLGGAVSGVIGGLGSLAGGGKNQSRFLNFKERDRHQLQKVKRFKNDPFAVGTSEKGIQVVTKQAEDMGLLTPGRMVGFDTDSGKIVFEDPSLLQRTGQAFQTPTPNEIADRIYREDGISRKLGETINETYDNLFPPGGASSLPTMPNGKLVAGQFNREKILSNPKIQKILNRNKNPDNIKILDSYMKDLFGAPPELNKVTDNIKKLEGSLLKSKNKEAEFSRLKNIASDNFLVRTAHSRKERIKDWEALTKKFEVTEDQALEAYSALDIAAQEATLAMGVEDKLYRQKALLRLKKAETAKNRAKIARDQVRATIKEQQKLMSQPEWDVTSARRMHELDLKLKSQISESDKIIKSLIDLNQGMSDEMNKLATTATVQDVRNVMRDIGETVRNSKAKAQNTASPDDLALMGIWDALGDMVDDEVRKVDPQALKKLDRMKEQYGIVQMIGENADAAAFASKDASALSDSRIYLSSGAPRVNMNSSSGFKSKVDRTRNALRRTIEDQSDMIPNARTSLEGFRSRGLQPILNTINQPATLGPVGGREPQSIMPPEINPDDFDFDWGKLSPTFDETPDEALQKLTIPRTFDGIMDNRDIILAKAARMNPEMIPQISSMLSMNPKELKDQLPVIVESFPELFDYDDYGRVDGVIIDPAMVIKARKDIQNDDTLSNVQKAKLINELNKNNKLEGYKE